MELRRSFAGLTVSLVLLGAAPALAQQNVAALVGPLDQGTGTQAPGPRRLEFRAPEGDLRQPVAQRSNGLLAAVPLYDNLEIGVGRFLVPELARPRTHMESDRQPTAVRSRDSGIAAIGFSYRF
jgi:hypothetical protein